MDSFAKDSRPAYRLWCARLTFAAGGVAITILLASCSSRNDEDQPLARVEDRTISLSELRAATNLNITSSGESAEGWIDEAVLAHHAGKSDFAIDEELGKRIQAYQQRLYSSLYLDSLLVHRIFVNPEAARFYYADNIDTFRFRADAAVVYHFGFSHLETAETALALFKSSSTSIDSLMDLYHYDRRLVYRGQLMPLLEEAVFEAELNEFTSPVKSDFGYHIFRVERLFRQGDTIPYAYVRKYIYEKLFQRQLPLEQLAILDSLREVTDIELSNE